MERLEQLSLWQKGQSVHNDQFDECCPDLSCCYNNIETPQHEKDLFVEAYLNNDDKLVQVFWVNFMSRHIAKGNEILDIKTV